VYNFRNMIVLAIDPGSVTAGYALLKKEGRKVQYIASGVLSFSGQVEFLDRVKDIYDKTLKLANQFTPDEIALESLIYVKSPTALIKLAQSRGAMLAALTQKYHQKIYEYSPNLVKSTVTGHGHADKEGVQKVLMQSLGLSDFKSHDESDAIAIALCHLLNKDTHLVSKILNPKRATKKGSNGLAASLAHRIKDKSI
jgi:crossover junction endodeoxyribonuclease RuvC